MDELYTAGFNYREAPEELRSLLNLLFNLSWDNTKRCAAFESKITDTKILTYQQLFAYLEGPSLAVKDNPRPVWKAIISTTKNCIGGPTPTYQTPSLLCLL